MAIILYSSAIIAITTNIYLKHEAEKLLKPFIKAAKNEVNLNCDIKSIGDREYFLLCDSQKIKDIKYSDVDELVINYQEIFVNPLLKKYPHELRVDNIELLLGIHSRSGIVACYQIKTPGTVTKAWHSGKKEPCEKHL